MLLTITTSEPPATDLGFLLHKNPARVQAFDLAFGRAHVFYPEASEARCTAALLLDIDPVALVRNRRGPAGEGGALEEYVNDRPYVASSFLAVAIAQVYGSALAGRCTARPDLAERPLALEARLTAVPCRGGEGFLRRLFEPLGYEVKAAARPLDPRFPEWGDARSLTVEIAARVRLQDLLTHLYVLVPVLDDEKHYWVGDDEVEKLLRRGEGWLAAHPLRDAIVDRYLRHQRRLARAALARLADEDAPDPDAVASARADEEAAIERPLSLAERRMAAVVSALKDAAGARRVVDLGCGEGKLLRALLDDRAFEEIVGLDVSVRALEIAKERLHLDRMPEKKRERVKLLHGSLTYRDARIAGFDAAAVVEVVEHLDPPRLAAFERVLFEHARPRTIVLTTPNAEHNVRFGLAPGRFRHRDHRFEWTRAELESWARAIASRSGYGVRFAGVGDDDAEVGAPTQMATFTR